MCEFYCHIGYFSRNRGTKKSAKQQVATDDDESDDSLLGEDSPFVKQQATRTRWAHDIFD